MGDRHTVYHCAALFAMTLAHVRPPPLPVSLPPCNCPAPPNHVNHTVGPACQNLGTN
jgi:hypothetical protein